MTRLDCSVHNCANNNDNYCCISSIYVGGRNAKKKSNTDCESFIKKNNGFTNCTVNPNPNVEISCEANNCIYNSNNICTAESITVTGKCANCTEDTICSSFCCK